MKNAVLVLFMFLAMYGLMSTEPSTVRDYIAKEQAQMKKQK